VFITLTLEKQMKAEHRHELKTNELAQWLGNLPQWTKDNLTVIIAAIVILALCAGSYYYFGRHKKDADLAEEKRLTNLLSQSLQNKRQVLATHMSEEGEDTSFMLLRQADELAAFANSAGDQHRAAFALIQAAEAVRTELHYRSTPVAQGELKKQIERAKGYYNKALLTLDNRSLEAVARLGLGLCEEELGNYTGAEQIYRDIIANPEFEHTIASVKAGKRINTLAQYQKPVVLATSTPTQRPIGAQIPPRPGSAGAARPQIQIGDPEIYVPSVPTKETAPTEQPGEQPDDSTEASPADNTAGSDSNQSGQ
jgi:tetratricopeptide (TPR) repeat protein